MHPIYQFTAASYPELICTFHNIDLARQDGDSHYGPEVDILQVGEILRRGGERGGREGSEASGCEMSAFVATCR